MARWATLKRVEAEDGDGPARVEVILIQDREGGKPEAPRISDPKMAARYSFAKVDEDVEEGMIQGGIVGEVVQAMIRKENPDGTFRETKGSKFVTRTAKYGWQSEEQARANRNLNEAVKAAARKE